MNNTIKFKNRDNQLQIKKFNLIVFVEKNLKKKNTIEYKWIQNIIIFLSETMFKDVVKFSNASKTVFEYLQIIEAELDALHHDLSVIKNGVPSSAFSQLGSIIIKQWWFYND